MTHDLLSGRWSPTIFDTEREIGDAELAEILLAAQWAPSAGNSQPWAFIVLRRGDERHERFTKFLSRGNAGWVPRAALVIVTLAQIATEPGGDSPSYSDYAEYDVGQAAAHITVQATAMGLGVHQFAGFDHERVAHEFAIPDNFKVLTGMAIGRRATPEQIAIADPRDQEREQRVRSRRDLTLF
jgi:nitroreductase